MSATRSSAIAHAVAVLLDPDSHRQQLVAVVQRRVDGARRHLLLDRPEAEAELALVAGFRALSGAGVAASDFENSKYYLPTLIHAASLEEDLTLSDLAAALRRLQQRGVFVHDETGNHRRKGRLRLADSQQQANGDPAPGAGQHVSADAMEPRREADRA